MPESSDAAVFTTAGKATLKTKTNKAAAAAAVG